jgi:iron complex outermembrane receptor protein
MMGKTMLKTAVGVVTFIGVSLAVTAENDRSTEPGLEEVVVTAQKREQNLQETPLSTSTFDGQALEDLGISDIEVISIYVPNVQISETPGGSAGATMGIRGSVTINPAVTWEPAVGIYIDGMFVAKNIGGLFDVAEIERLEIERLEILRGPQGTLYGKNTIGGAVNLVTRKPSGDGGGKIGLGAGDYDCKDLFLSVDSDTYLDDTLRFNVAFNKKRA